MRRHKGIMIALLLIILPSVSILSLKSVVAAPTYTITPAAPGRIQEGYSIALTLSVTGLTPTTQYIFFINVTQPDFSIHAAQILLTTDVNGAASGIKTYPTDFGTPSQGNTNFVGTYSVVVQEASPTPTLNLATTSFVVGLTDKTTYQRTNTVLIQASGYANNELVTVDISTNGGTTHANGFPLVVHASSTGIVLAGWVIPYSTPTGSWTVSASGASTLKAPTDQQTITINIAAFLVTVTTDQKIYARTQTITAYATVQYPNGTVLGGITFPSTPTGSPPDSFPDVTVTFRNGSIFRTMDWNATAQNWYFAYTIPANLNNPSTLPQLWNIQVTAMDNWNNAGSGQSSVTIQLTPPNFDLQITARNSTAFLANVFLNITYGNGTIATSGYTDATGNAFFTLPEGDSYSYVVVASHNGYDDYPDSFFLQGNLMHRTYRMANVYYSGTILSGSYTTAAHYNPGDSGTLVVWIYNQNTTFPIFITKIVVEFPWYNTYGNAYLGNASIPLPASGQQVLPKTNWNTTISFTVPNDGRLYSGIGGVIYISARVTAWKNVWTISSTGGLVGSRVLDSNTYVDAKANPIYDGQGFLTFDRISISFATQDTGLAGQLTIMEILMGFFVVNVVLLVLIWMRLKPAGHTGLMPKA